MHFKVWSVTFTYVIAKMPLQIVTRQLMEQVSLSSKSCLISSTTTPNNVMEAIKLTDSCDSVSFLIITKRQAANTAEFS